MRLTVRPERLVAGGEALARDDDGRVVFVRGALPGELVVAEVRTAKRDFARAVAVDVLEPSPDRIVPPCAHRRAGCGGCGWMHLRPQAQRAARIGIVGEALRRVGRIDAAVVDGLVRHGRSADVVGYRTTVRVVGDERRRPSFRVEGGDELVAVDHCPVADPELSAVLADLEVAPGVELTLRRSAWSGRLGATWRPRGADVVHGLPEGTQVGDRAVLTERVAGRELRVSMGSFFQSGVQAAELLVDAVERAAADVPDPRRVVDAYGGIGLFACTALARAGHVTLLESSARACDDARHNLRDRAARVVRTEVGRWRAEAGAAIDLVVADPARPGLGRPGVAAVVSTRPAPLVLVSCDPVSLARDAALLAEHGYRPESVEIVDVFAQTSHVETVTRFTPVVP